MARVIHVSTAHPSFDNRIFFKECVGLAKEGHDVHFLNSNGDSGLTIEGVQLYSTVKKRGRLHRMLVCVGHATLIVFKFPANIYHFHDPELMPTAMLLKLCGRKVIFDMHESLAKGILTKSWIPCSLRRPASAAAALLERLMLRRIGIIFAEASYAREFGSLSPARTVQNFPELSLLDRASGDKHSTFTIGYIGDVTRLRGVKTVLEAIDLLLARGRQVRFECVGPIEPEFQREIDSYCSRHPRDIVMHGYMKPREGMSVISNCHVGVAVLEPAPNYFESFPTKMFEYFALGLPAVVSDFPLYRSIIKEYGCGLTVEPADPGALADAIEKLIEDPEGCARMGRNARECIRQKFSWENEMKRLNELYALIQ